MYVYIREEGTKRYRIFGPATKSECMAWLKMKKFSFKNARTNNHKLLPEAHGPEKSLPAE